MLGTCLSIDVGDDLFFMILLAVALADQRSTALTADLLQRSARVRAYAVHDAAAAGCLAAWPTAGHHAVATWHA